MSHVLLAEQRPFAQGGHRLCYVDPRDASRCIKVLRQDRSLAKRRRRKGGLKRLRSLDSFDDNLEESRVLESFAQCFPPEVLTHVPKHFGWVDSDRGRGLVVGLLRDEDGRISLSLKQQLWEQGCDETCTGAVKALARVWSTYGVPSRELLLHNLVLQRQAPGRERVVVVDGLGSSDFLPFARWSRGLGQRKAARKIRRLEARIEELLARKQTGGDPGTHGFLRFR
ncbi:MAG: YrbL family protein [Gammaproteobacteria bacterium]|jgi:hypothetical protein|nr:YrbL family protein [Gammaproteobacteria bacterium]